jgi:hypothetical protein
MRSESQRAELDRTGEGLNVFERYVFARHAIFCVIVVLLYLLLNRPEVILLSQLGYSVWYPATGLILAVMVGISPWYFPLTVLAGALAGVVIYHQPLLSWSGLATPLLGSGSYAVAAYLLRGPLKIDLALRRRRDVLRYISVTLGAAVFATVSGNCLPSRRRYDFVGSILPLGLGMVCRRRGWFSWICTIPSYSFASNCFADALSLACKDHAKAAACESENRADEGARGLGVDRTIQQHDFGALDYVWANSGI